MALKNSQGSSLTSSTSPTGNPFGYTPPIPEVTAMSPGATSPVFST